MSMQPRLTDMTVDADALAAGATAEIVVGVVREAGATADVTAVRYAPAATITGAAVNSRTLRLINRTQASAVIAELALVSGVNAPAGAETTIPITGNASPAIGDILHWQSMSVGSGLADPGGKVRITISRTRTPQ